MHFKNYTQLSSLTLAGTSSSLTAHFAAVVADHAGLTNISICTSLAVPTSIARSTCRTGWSAISTQDTCVTETAMTRIQQVSFFYNFSNPFKIFDHTKLRYVYLDTLTHIGILIYISCKKTTPLPQF